jgi:hypothetical protein
MKGDRGMVKWRGFLLPEHVTMLRKLKQESNFKKKPELDEHYLAPLMSLDTY